LGETEKIKDSRVQGFQGYCKNYGLSSQMRRAAVSIPSNISEGYGRKTTLDYIRSLYIAYGSNCELETQTLLSSDLGILKMKPQKSSGENFRGRKDAQSFNKVT
jgi:four helix bundle protein